MQRKLILPVLLRGSVLVHGLGYHFTDLLPVAFA